MFERMIKHQDGEPCSNTCRHHVSHPCEECGRQDCKGVVYENTSIYQSYIYGNCVMTEVATISLVHAFETGISVEEACEWSETYHPRKYFSDYILSIKPISTGVFAFSIPLKSDNADCR